MPALANRKHEAVALALFADPERIGWRAYQGVHPRSSRHTCETAIWRLRQDPVFAARLSELAELAAQGAVMTKREVLLELSRLGRANMADYMRVGPDGDPVLDFTALTRDQAAALVQVTVDDYLDGRGEDAREVKRVKFTLAKKTEALELLGKHHKLFTDRLEVTGNAGLADRLAAAIARTNRKDEPDGEGRPHRRAPRQRRPRAPARRGKRARA